METPFPKAAARQNSQDIVLLMAFQTLPSLTGKKMRFFLVTYFTGISCGDANPCHKTLRRFRPYGDPMNTLSTFI